MTEQDEIRAIFEQWEVSRGKPKVYTYTEFLSFLDRIHPGSAPNVLHWLSNKNLIRHNGSSVCITNQGMKIFPKNRLVYILDSTDRTLGIEAEWRDFRKLLDYYIQCVKTEDRKEFHLYTTKQGHQFYIPPSIPALWFPSHKSSYEPDLIVSLKASETVILHAITVSTESSPEACIGYPVEAKFDENGDVYEYVPLFMIPISFVKDVSRDDRPGKDYKVQIKPLFDKASYNFEWITRNCDMSQLDGLFEELDDDQNLIHALRTILGYSVYSKQADEFAPERTIQSLPVVSRKRQRRKLCNTVVIFRTDNSVFNNSLIRELEMIRKADAVELDKSALAYIFRKHPFHNENKEKPVAIPFLPSNSEQLEAVENALANHLSVLQGPPGTGKSQVAVNLIANCIYRGLSVAFSSRNHAALDAIRERADSLLSSISIPLVRYCNSPDGSITDWFSVKPEEDARTILASLPANGESSDRIIQDSMITVSDIRKISEEKNRIISDYLLVEQDYLEKRNHLESLLIHSDSAEPNPEIFDLSNIVVNGRRTGLSGSIYRFLHRKEIGRAEDILLNKYHVVAAISVDKKEALFKRCVDLDNASVEYNAAKDAVDAAYDKYHKLIDNGKDYSDNYNKAIQQMSSSASFSLLYQWGKKISNLDEKDYEFIGQQRSAASKLTPFSRNVSRDDIVKIADAERKLFSIVPAWAVSLLSARHVAPLVAGVFDMVIIDEASQCDCVSVIPMLFRAKRAMIIGDPKQFRPIVTMTKRRHDQILNKYYSRDSNTAHFEFYSNSAYSVAAHFVASSMLKEHFRCDVDIASFINSAFYDGNLRIRTNEKPLNYPPGMETGDHLRWIEVDEGIEQEIMACIDFLREMKSKKYTGSIGVITPLRENADKLANEIYGAGFSFDEIKVDTAYGFQGGECDLILFVLGYTQNLKNKQVWYITSEDNNNIYDVALSRARACLLIIGNKSLCRKSSSRMLRRLAEYPQKREENVAFESPWEERLFTALLSAGITTQPQYNFLGYRFDLAYQDEYVKLDIEVDGYQYHFNADGSRKESDFRRDAAIEKYGWKPVRFVVKELIDNMDYCVEKIRVEINHARNRAYI